MSIYTLTFNIYDCSYIYVHYLAAEVTFALVFNLNEDKPTGCDLFLLVQLPNYFKR